MKSTVRVYESKEISVQDWHGNELRPEALQHPKVGNIVRVVMKDEATKWAEAIYVMILEVSSQEYLKGQVLDIYRHSIPEFDSNDSTFAVGKKG